MGEITKPGYQDLQNYIAEHWTIVSVRHGEDEVVRLPPGPGQLTVTPEEGRLVYRVTLTGADLNASDTNKVPVDGSAVFAEAAPEMRAYEPFSRVEFQHPRDQLTITHNINVGGMSMIAWGEYSGTTQTKQFWTEDANVPGVLPTDIVLTDVLYVSGDLDRSAFVQARPQTDRITFRYTRMSGGLTQGQNIATRYVVLRP